MSMLSLARRLFRKPLRCAPSTRAVPKRVRLAVTPLEDRVNPTPTVSVAAIANVTFTENSGATDILEMTRTGTTGWLLVSGMVGGTANSGD